jgi:hypothetical protein
VKEAVTSLVVGECVISQCEDGLFVTEYALFDPSEAMVFAEAGQGVREQGYLTTAGSARERLYAEGITSELAHEALRALRPRHMRALARSSSVLRAIDLLSPYEAFQGGAYCSRNGTYDGEWLDMAALARACPLRNAACLFQALHLIQVVEEVSDDVPVRLLTVNATGNLRAGERTWSRVVLESARRLPAVLRAMRVPARANEDGRDEGEVREVLLRGLRARSVMSRTSQPRIRSLATRVAGTGSTPPSSAAVREDAAGGGELGTPPRPPSEPPATTGVGARDPTAMFEELRGHTQLLRGEDHLRAVAQFLSAMAERSSSQPDLGVLASRAWLAAGEPGHARHFAKQVVENPVAPDAMRLLALEIIDSTEAQISSAPPRVEAPPIVPTPILNAVPHEQFTAPGASLPPFAPESPASPSALPSVMPVQAFLEPFTGPETERMAADPSPAAPHVVTSPVVFVQGAPHVREAALEITVSNLSPPAVLDPAVTALAPGRSSSQTRPEIVESLSLPTGLEEAMLEAGARPTSPGQARIAMTRLARTLGRDYRLWYGTTLMTNAVAIEAMQRHLRRRFDNASADASSARKLEAELTRHGALLAEILARRLRGEWVDLSGDLPGRWAMVVYPNVRVWPIGRVYRFFKHGHREADLLAFFLDLEARAPRS